MKMLLEPPWSAYVLIALFRLSMLGVLPKKRERQFTFKIPPFSGLSMHAQNDLQALLENRHLDRDVREPVIHRLVRAGREGRVVLGVGVVVRYRTDPVHTFSKSASV